MASKRLYGNDNASKNHSNKAQASMDLKAGGAFAGVSAKASASRDKADKAATKASSGKVSTKKPKK